METLCGRRCRLADRSATRPLPHPRLPAMPLRLRVDKARLRRRSKWPRQARNTGSRSRPSRSCRPTWCGCRPEICRAHMRALARSTAPIGCVRHRPVRGHEPSVQGIRRPGRLPEPRLLDRTFRRERHDADLGSRDGAIRRSDRPARALDLGSRRLSRKATATIRLTGVSWYEAPRTRRSRANVCRPSITGSAPPTPTTATS